jgi:hypothetical protein
MKQRLGRNATGPEAFSADSRLFHQSDTGAQRASDIPGDQPCAAATQNAEIIIVLLSRHSEKMSFIARFL